MAQREVDVEGELFAQRKRPVLRLGQELGGFPASRDEVHVLNHFVSRHSRRVSRARWSITQQFVAVTPSSLHISSVVSSRTSRITNTRAVRAGITWTHISKTFQNSLDSKLRSG